MVKKLLGRLFVSALFVMGLIILPLQPAGAAGQGDAWTWGYGAYGQLGFGANSTSAQATQLSSIGQIKAISGGCYHTLALKPDGTVWAWGYNAFGQLGIGNDTDVNAPTQVTGIASVVAISGGCYHSVAVKSDGTVWTWGNSGTFNLGTGSAPAPDHCRGFGGGIGCAMTPVQAINLSGITSVAAGITVDVALKNDGTVWEWGDFYHNTPTQVAGITGATAVATGSYHMLALKSDGTVWSWGSNAALGNGNVGTNYTPAQVIGVSNAVGVAANGWHSLVLESDGTVWAWGRNSEGQIGTGSITSAGVLNATQVVGLSNVKQVAASLLSSYALKNDGTTWAWGYGYDGEYGDGVFRAPSASPIQITSVNNASYITGGAYHVMAIVQNNQPPTVNAGGPYNVVEGTSITVSAMGSDPENGSLTYAWDLDNNGSFETPGQSVTFDASALVAPDSKTVKVQVTDDGGLTAVDESTVNVTYGFGGVLQPVDSLPTLNVANAGRTIPIKFSLGGDKGLGIFAAGYPASQQITCDSSTPTDVIEETMSTGSGLTYDSATGQYSYKWKTDGSWQGTCRQLTLQFNDGTHYQANFKFN